jgi:hypothetical protein
MEVAPVLLDQLLGRGLLVASERAPLVEPPPRRARVECADVELVDHDRGSGNENVREPPERLGQRVDVVERDDGNSGVEGCGRLVELVQSTGPDVRAAGCGIDGEDVVAGAAQCPRELAVARANFEDARRRSGKVGANERVEIGGDHGLGGYAPAPAEWPAYWLRLFD